MPDELWRLVEPLPLDFVPRKQGGGNAPVEQRSVFTAVVYVPTSSCAWRMLPPSFGVTGPTARIAGSVRGPRSACGGTCTARCSTRWAAEV